MRSADIKVGECYLFASPGFPHLRWGLVKGTRQRRDTNQGTAAHDGVLVEICRDPRPGAKAGSVKHAGRRHFILTAHEHDERFQLDPAQTTLGGLIMLTPRDVVCDAVEAAAVRETAAAIAAKVDTFFPISSTDHSRQAAQVQATATGRGISPAAVALGDE